MIQILRIRNDPLKTDLSRLPLSIRLFFPSTDDFELKWARREQGRTISRDVGDPSIQIGDGDKFVA